MNIHIVHTQNLAIFIKSVSNVIDVKFSDIVELLAIPLSYLKEFQSCSYYILPSGYGSPNGCVNYACFSKSSQDNFERLLY